MTTNSFENKLYSGEQVVRRNFDFLGAICILRPLSRVTLRACCAYTVDGFNRATPSVEHAVRQVTESNFFLRSERKRAQKKSQAVCVIMSRVRVHTRINVKVHAQTPRRYIIIIMITHAVREKSCGEKSRTFFIEIRKYMTTTTTG